MNREELLKKEILNQYKSLRQFAQEIGIAPSTLTTILNNGIGGTSIDTVLTICEKLNLDINLFHEGVQKDQEMVSESEISYIKKIRALNKKARILSWV